MVTYAQATIWKETTKINNSKTRGCPKNYFLLGQNIISCILSATVTINVNQLFQYAENGDLAKIITFETPFSF